MGRGVRHPKDYCFVYLCDFRYTKLLKTIQKFLGDIILKDLSIDKLK